MVALMSDFGETGAVLASVKKHASAMTAIGAWYHMISDVGSYGAQWCVASVTVDLLESISYRWEFTMWVISLRRLAFVPYCRSMVDVWCYRPR